MREILFRGKSTYDGSWVFGSLMIHPELERVAIQNHSETFDDHDFWYSGVEVVPKTVSQYTGIDDIYGCKIFEGDIVKFIGDPPDEPCFVEEIRNLVVFEQGCFKLRKSYEIGSNEEVYDYLDDWENPVVLGNIHDDPELLEDR